MDTTHPSIQSFLGTAYPTFCYEIYRKDGQIYGHKIDWKHWSEVLRDFPASHDISGRKVRYVLCSNDRSINRREALEFAIRVWEEKYRIISVDLSHVNGDAK